MTTPFACYICHEHISPNTPTSIFYTPNARPTSPSTPSYITEPTFDVIPHTVHLSCYQHLLRLEPTNAPRVFPKYTQE